MRYDASKKVYRTWGTVRPSTATVAEKQEEQSENCFTYATG